MAVELVDPSGLALRVVSGTHRLEALPAQEPHVFNFGHEVVRDNHIGDWGTQFGKVIYGWKHWRDEAALKSAPVEELVRLYKKAHGLSETDENVLRECREELVKLQVGHIAHPVEEAAQAQASGDVAAAPKPSQEGKSRRPTRLARGTGSCHGARPESFLSV